MRGNDFIRVDNVFFRFIYFFVVFVENYVLVV